MHAPPPIGWMPERTHPGLDRLDGQTPVTFLKTNSFEETFTTKHNTDAHFVTYNILGEPQWPRINKTAVFDIEKAGGKVRSTCFAFDYDLPSKQTWDQENLESFLSKIENTQDKVFKNPNVFYLTRHGARWVWVLSEPLEVGMHAPYWTALLDSFRGLGWDFDPACANWGRIFRLPLVTRPSDDGGIAEPSWSRETLLSLDLTPRLDLKTIEPKLEYKQTFSQGSRSEVLGKPADEDIREFRWAHYEHTKAAKPGWLVEAKNRLKNRDSFTAIFSANPKISSPGSRDSTIQQYVGSAVSLLHNLEGMCKEKIYGLFYDSVVVLTPDSDTPDWTNVLWRAVCRYYDQEDAKVAAEKEQKKSVWDIIIEGISKWHPDILNMTPLEAQSWALQRAILCGKKSYHIMRMDGWYDDQSVIKDHIVARIKELGTDQIIQVTSPNGYVSNSDLINGYGSIIGAIEGAGGKPGSYLEGLPNKPKLILNGYNLKQDLVPTHDKDVEYLLWLWAGENEAKFRKLCGWLAWSLAFEEGPICALAIVGPPGIGKKMIARALAECIDTECFATASELGQYQSVLLHTPFLILDEGIPQTKQGVQSFADQFRSKIAGDGITVERKFVDSVLVRAALRLLFTANNIDILIPALGQKDLTPEDRDAFIQRLRYLEVGTGAADWLRGQGGLDFTSGWVRGDSGHVASDYRFAKHIFYLHSKRHDYPKGSRLLQEGELNETAFSDLLVRSGSAPLVVDMLCQMIEQVNLPDGIVIDENNDVFVLTQAIVEFFRACVKRSPIRDDLSASKVAQILKGLTTAHGYAHNATKRIVKKRNVRGRFHQLDLMQLLGQALKYGYKCNNLITVICAKKGISEAELFNEVKQTKLL